MKKCLCFAGVFLFLIGCGRNVGNKTILKVGAEKLTVSDIAYRLKSLSANYSEFMASDAGRKQLIDLLIRERIILNAARKEGIGKRKEITDIFDDYKKNYKKKLKEYEENLILQTYLSELEEKKLNVPEEEVRGYYEDHRGDFLTPVKFDISHILLSTEDEAENARKRIKSGEGFSELAKAVSIDTESSIRGGAMGSFKKSELLPEFRDIVSKLKVGTVSDVISTPYGYHIIKKTGERRLPSQSFNESTREIKMMLIKKKFDDWLAAEKNKLNIKVDYDALKLVSTFK